MKRVSVLIAFLVAIACSSGVFVESCGAMGFELPPEEPQAETSARPRLLRRDAGDAELGARGDTP